MKYVFYLYKRREFLGRNDYTGSKIEPLEIVYGSLEAGRVNYEGLRSFTYGRKDPRYFTLDIKNFEKYLIKPGPALSHIFKSFKVPK